MSLSAVAEKKPPLYRVRSRTTVLLAAALSVATLPASAQLFSTDRPLRGDRQPAPFGGFDYSQPPQRRAPEFAPRFGFGAPPVTQQAAPPPVESRFPFRPKQPRKPPPLVHVDYSRPPPAEKPDVAPKRSIIVIGDEMADWLAHGLETVLSDQSDLGVVRQTKTIPGLIQSRPKRGEPSDWLVAAKAVATMPHIDAIVVMLGMHDRASIRETNGAPVARAAEADDTARQPEEMEAASEETDGSKAIEADKSPQPANGIDEFRSTRWTELYVSKVRRMIAVLKSSGVPVVWVGLPSLKGQQATSDMLFLDELYRDNAARAGIAYADPWSGFVDEAGRFMQYGPDFEGQARKLRSPDGVFFTHRGAMKLARYVEPEIRKLLAARELLVSLQPEPAAAIAPGKPTARPLAGPVLPLLAPSVGTKELLGAAGGQPAALDELAARTLVRGEPLSPPAGRADNFAWPRPELGRIDLASDDTPATGSNNKPAETTANGVERLRYTQRER